MKEITGCVLPLPYEAQEVERTLQALLDAISAIEHATEVQIRDGERILWRDGAEPLGSDQF